MLSIETILLKPCLMLKALDIPEWKASIQCEYNALIANGTWDLVLKPKDKKTIGHKWVFLPKLQDDKPLDKSKSRVVAKGFQQT